jgi:hypothetical protein
VGTTPTRVGSGQKKGECNTLPIIQWNTLDWNLLTYVNISGHMGKQPFMVSLKIFIRFSWTKLWSNQENRA